ncbi:MAG TPA: hypothetical protein VHP14_00300, partial [Anaerolineales bacterium]|nr:hypothetical protein [Anaerolineales bacterium]
NSASGDSVRYAVKDNFFAHYYPLPDTPGPQPPADFAERIAPYLGEYSAARNSFTTIEKALTLLSPAITLSVTEDGYLSTGDGQLFVEVEPGLLQLRDDPNSRLAYRTGTDGQQYLFASGSTSALFKTPWYGSVTLHQILWMTILVFFLIALIRWSYGFLKDLRKREPQPAPSRLAHWNAGIFGLLFIILVACFAALMLDNVPVYEIPRFFFADESTALLNFILFLPWLLALTGFAMPVFTWLAWNKKFWNLSGRIFYTLLSLCALTGIWLLAYWNFWL